MNKKLFIIITVLGMVFAGSAAAMERGFRTPRATFFGIGPFGDSEETVSKEIFKLSEANRPQYADLFAGTARSRNASGNRNAASWQRGYGFWSQYSNRLPVNRRLFADSNYDHNKPSFLEDDFYEEKTYEEKSYE